MRAVWLLLSILMAQGATLPAADSVSHWPPRHSRAGRSLRVTDFVGSDPRGSDPRGADVVGSDPVGQDTVGRGGGRPPAPAPPAERAGRGPGCTSAAALLASNPNTTTFQRLAQSGGIDSYLQSSSRQFMLFAPDNIAWQSLFQGFGLSEEQLLADRELLQAILEYHIVPGPPVPVQQWTASRRFPTLAPGQSLEAVPPTASSNFYFVQGAQGYLLGGVLRPDLLACAALVNVIGSVMVSPAADGLLTQRGLVPSG